MEKDDWVEIILSKTKMQKEKTLKDIRFSDYEDSIRRISTVEYAIKKKKFEQLNGSLKTSCFFSLFMFKLT